MGIGRIERGFIAYSPFLRPAARDKPGGYTVSSIAVLLPSAGGVLGLIVQ